MSEENRKGIMIKAYLVYLGIFLLGLMILGKALYIQYFEKKALLDLARTQEMQVFPIGAIRGNILSDNGTLLAVSTPVFEIRMDMDADSLSEEVFRSGIDSLAIMLASLSKGTYPSEIKGKLWEAYRNGERFFLLKRDVAYPELKKIRKFPILRRGRFKGGLIIVPQWERELPYKSLARRIIGYEKGDGDKKVYVGLEGKFTKELEGVRGYQMKRRVGRGAWMPVDLGSQVEPQDGFDVVTTIDIELQDMAESALRRQLIADSADHGCLIVMEVSTGYIKAMVNLGKAKNGVYEEIYNYSIGECTEPGSTFKLASFLVAMDDGKIEPGTLVNTGDGTVYYSGQKMEDSHHGGFGTITAQQVFEHSSNVGTSRMITSSYGNNPQKYIDGLYKLGLNKPLDLQIDGEGIPYIKNTRSKSWSAVSLPWISIGYEIRLAPVHLITLYNAVANNGVLVKPLFVKEIRRNGRVVTRFEPEVINPRIASLATIQKARSLMEGVVLRGTGKAIFTPVYAIAGKTGTAQIAMNNRGYNQGTRNIRYKGSFVGFFPAENPKYTMIVVIVDPRKGKYYGADVAAPVFREISDRLYVRQEEISSPVKKDSLHELLPCAHKGFSHDLQEVYRDLGYNSNFSGQPAPWASVSTAAGQVVFSPETDRPFLMPDVSGMGLKDAMFRLEKLGLKVTASGKGAVVSQSVKPGTMILRGMPVTIELQVYSPKSRLQS